MNINVEIEMINIISTVWKILMQMVVTFFIWLYGHAVAWLFYEIG